MVGLNDFKKIFFGRTSSVFRRDLDLFLTDLRAEVGDQCVVRASTRSCSWYSTVVLTACTARTRHHTGWCRSPHAVVLTACTAAGSACTVVGAVVPSWYSLEVRVGAGGAAGDSAGGNDAAGAGEVDHDLA
eukprot:1275442-Rhodomonas_salina.1